MLLLLKLSPNYAEVLIHKVIHVTEKQEIGYLRKTNFRLETLRRKGQRHTKKTAQIEQLNKLVFG